MASQAAVTTAFLLLFNLLFFSLVSAHNVPCPPPPHKPKPKPTPNPSPSTPNPSPSTPSPANPSPNPSPSTPSPANPTCPTDTLKLGACANVLSGLLNLNLGNAPDKTCCSLLSGLADIDAAVCLCTTIKAGILGINLNIPVDLSLLLNFCGKNVPSGYNCA